MNYDDMSRDELIADLKSTGHKLAAATAELDRLRADAGETCGPKFCASIYERSLIDSVVRRFCSGDYGIQNALQTAMDVEACHCNGTPLRLHALLGAHNADFGHDMLGIKKHIDRSTGNLEGIFQPRHALC